MANMNIKPLKKAVKDKEKALVVRNISKAFKDKMPRWMVLGRKTTKFYAVKDVSFEVEKGQIFGILGPNGCGKSTLIRMMATLLIPDKGDLKIFGHDVVKEESKVKQLINRVSVDAAFFKKLSAMENLMYAARLYGLKADYAKRKCKEILEELKFDMKKIDESMEDFSRGMQQKVSIARGFLSSPTLLLLDEPTTGLDPKSKRDVQAFINKIRREHNITIILSSHDMEEVDRLCDYIVVMDRGKIIARGTSRELKKIVQKKEIYEIGTSDSKKTAKILKSIPGVKGVAFEDGKTRFSVKNLDAVIRKITTDLSRNKIKFKNLTKVVPTLEDVFLDLTGKKLED